MPETERVWIAGRYDRTRVVLYFDTATFHGTIPAGAPTMKAPVAVFPFDARVLPAAYIARLPRARDAEHFAVGDHYDLLLDGGRAFTVTLTTLVGFESDEYVGNSSYIGALGTLATADVPRFASQSYFVARRHVDQDPRAAAAHTDRRAPAAGLVRTPVPAGTRQRVTALLRARLATDADSAVRADVRTVPLRLEKVQPFRLAGGVLRYHVKARMEIVGTVCWMIDAWMMPPPKAQLMEGTVRTCLLDGPHGTPELLSVVSLGDGRTGLTLFVPQGDGWSYYLMEYRDGEGFGKMRILRGLTFGE